VPRRIVRNVSRPPTPEERARFEELSRQVEAELPELRRQAKRSLDRYERGLVSTLRKTGVFDLPATVAALKVAREEQGLTLAQVSAATGMSVPALSSLETGRNDNPTLRTLQRYAKAIGRRFVVGLVEDRGGDAPEKAGAVTGDSPRSRSKKVRG